MELQTITENLELQPQESQQLAPSNNTFQQAITQKRINQDLDGLTDALKYAMALVGIRGQNAPTQAEFDFLKFYLVNNFGSHTAAEIRLAFDLAVSNRLELGESGATCYENFSCEYVGRIMSAYRKWAEIQHKDLPNNPPAALLEYRMPRIDWAEEWELLKEAAKNGTIEKVIIVTPLYDWLVENGLINLTGPEKKMFFVHARAALIREIVDCGNLTYDQKKELEILRSDGWYKNDLVKIKLQNKSKILAVKWLALK
jgi:hypothetical protein